MYRLSLIIALLTAFCQASFSQTNGKSPHGKNLKMDCAACHTTNGWDIPFDRWNFSSEASKSGLFNHTNTNFPLTGGHLSVDCRTCHPSLVFEEAPDQCVNCHTDLHGMTVGNDCARCHTTESWLVDDIPQLHEQVGFPLTGVHEMLFCTDCHRSETNLRFDRMGNDCIVCHKEDYEMTTSPNHPSIGFGVNCLECHTTESGWEDVTSFPDHDAVYFPIYTGTHEGVWVQCLDCHPVADNFSDFSCTGCHTNPETDNIHSGFSTYVYESNACLACHPSGEADDNFDHSLTGFPLLGAHEGLDCAECHTQDNQNLTGNCVECHQQDYLASANPNHAALNFPQDCAACHTFDPGWAPATFDIHDDYYQLLGAHAMIASDCAVCHNGDYNNTPNTCMGCHQADYVNTTDPNHQEVQFPTTCTDCHTQDEWTPATFDHDGQYFPIYSGTHEGEWMQCQDCHTTPGNFSIVQCTNCHTNPETNNNHNGISGYVYEDNACLACHPNGEALDNFDHNLTNFPLTGAHVGVNCQECHTNGYAGTSTFCFDCHQQDFEASTNPNHTALNFPNDCASCHTTAPGWSPATFDLHDNYYPLTGGHALVANDCAACHNGNYNNTPTTCAACHQSDYNSSTNPNHTALNFPNDCASCHTTDPGWSPASFDIHDDYYPLNGAHALIADNCVACHNGNYNNTPNTCFGCHQPDYNSANNPNHSGDGYPTDCTLCHDEDSWASSFDHDGDFFPIYSGKHKNKWDVCADCHINANDFSIFSCIDCHEHDNPAELADKHSGVNGYIYESSACYSCHPSP